MQQKVVSLVRWLVLLSAVMTVVTLDILYFVVTAPVYLVVISGLVYFLTVYALIISGIGFLLFEGVFTVVQSSVRNWLAAADHDPAKADFGKDTPDENEPEGQEQ